MLIENLTPAQRKITKHICILQLESLTRLLNNESEDDTDITMFLIENEVTRDEYEEQLQKNITKFKRLKDEPDNLRVLDEIDLSKFRHILSSVENRFNDNYPKAISNLWRRLFLIERLNNMKEFSIGFN